MPRFDERINFELAVLKDDALRAVATGQPGALDAALDTYLDLLFAYPAAWRRYARDFGPDEAGAGGVLGYGPVHRVFADLQDIAARSIDSPDRETTAALSYFANRVTSRALEEGADALFAGASELPLWILAACLRRKDDASMSRVQSAWMHLTELATFSLERYLTQQIHPAEVRARAQRYMSIVYRRLIAAEKLAFDEDNISVLESIDERWDDVLIAWEPRGQDDPEVASAKRELDSLRDALRLGLAMWIHRRVASGGTAAAERALQYFASRFSDPSTLTRVMGTIMDTDLLHEGPWSMWHASTVKSRVFSWSGGGLDFDRLFADFVLRVPPTERGYVVPAAAWVKREEDPLVDAVKQEPHGVQLDAAEVERRRSQLLLAIDRAVAGQEEADARALIEAPVSPDRIAKFADDIRAGWMTRRLVATLFQRAGRYVTTTAKPPADERYFGFDQWLEKEWFIETPRVQAEHLAAPLGHQVAAGETTWFLAMVPPNQERLSSSESRARLREAITLMRSAGYDPDVIFAPADWRLFRELQVDEQWRDTDDLGALWKQFQGVEMVASRDVEPGRLIIVDLKRFATWKQWLRGTLDGLTVELEQFDQQHAVDTVAKFPKLFGADLETEAQVRKLQTQVLLRIRERFEISVDDANAARIVTIDIASTSAGPI